MPELTLRDVMTRDFVGVSESDTVHGAVRLMREDGVQNAVVLRGSEPVGAVSAADVLDLLVSDDDPDSTTVGSVMREEAPTLGPDSALGDVATAMLSNDSDLVLVESADELLGIITARDLARYALGSADSPDREPVVDRTEATLEGEADTSYSNQSICEVCGSLSRDLVNVNGQLLCPDCRAV